MNDKKYSLRPYLLAYKWHYAIGIFVLLAVDLANLYIPQFIGEIIDEGAIDIIDGKAELVREHFCDGLGDCLPECPTGAISFEEREAPAYDEEAVKEAQKKIAAKNRAMTSHSGCPGSKIMQIRRTETSEPVKATSTAVSGSKLQNWPVQIKLAPVNAPYFNGSKLLIAADCTAYAYAAFHQDFIRNKVTLIGCPKLDQVDYRRKEMSLWME